MLNRSRESSLDKNSFEVETEGVSLMTSSAEPSHPPKHAGYCCSLQTLMICTLALSQILVVAFSVYLKYGYDQRISNLEASVVLMQARVDDLETTTILKLGLYDSRVIEIESSEKRFQKSIWVEIVNQNESTASLLSTVREHDRMLVRLSNGTSNADVLDRLEETKMAVANQMANTQYHVDQKLMGAQRNVTEMLGSKVHEMQNVVSKATTNINEMERNITGRLNRMSEQLSVTVDEVNHSVADAQDTISDEVESVRENIRQYVAITNQQFAAENDFVKYQLAGFFTLLGCLIFLWHMTSHSRHYHKPDVQRRVMAVLWMVPIYGITSWLSLVYPKAEPYFATLRDCFEAYVVYTFVGFLIAILTDGMTFNQLLRKLSKLVEHEKELVEKYKHRQANPIAEAVDPIVGAETVSTLIPKEHLVPPFPCCYHQNDHRSIAAAWLYQCQLMALQFVIMKPLLTLIPLLVAVGGAYDMDNDSPWGDNSLNWESPKLYIMFLQNVSVMIAFYGLLSLYHGVEKDLEWCDPWPKFLCIKGVVFATFWQNIAIQGMTMFDLLDDRAASQISNLLICIEMLVASIAHIYIFPYQEWEPGYQKAKERNLALRDTMALGDFLKDMKMMVTKWEPDHKAGKSTPDHKDDFDMAAPVGTGVDNHVSGTGTENDHMCSLSPSSTGFSLIRDEASSYTPLESDKLLSDDSQSGAYGQFQHEMDHVFKEELERRIHKLQLVSNEEREDIGNHMYYQSSRQNSEERASV